ncbi:unnamed protein product [Amoebophrya sp. A25]|nr:unnamed protein product [Amoebophrya sp. A25]|eukprot:GSA25T00025916001.1
MISESLLLDPDRLGMDDPLTRQDKRLASEINKLYRMQKEILARFTNTPFVVVFAGSSAAAFLIGYFLFSYPLKDTHSWTQIFLHDFLQKYYYKEEPYEWHQKLRSWAVRGRWPHERHNLGADAELKHVMFGPTSAGNNMGDEGNQGSSGDADSTYNEDDSTPRLSVRERIDLEYGAPLRRKYREILSKDASNEAEKRKGSKMAEKLLAQMPAEDDEEAKRALLLEKERNKDTSTPEEKAHYADDEESSTSSTGLMIHSPIQLAAGFDYTGEMAFSLGGCGFGMVTVGPFEVVHVAAGREVEDVNEDTAEDPNTTAQTPTPPTSDPWSTVKNWDDVVDPETQQSRLRNASARISLDTFHRLPVFRVRTDNPGFFEQRRRVVSSVSRRTRIGVQLNITLADASSTALSKAENDALAYLAEQGSTANCSDEDNTAPAIDYAVFNLQPAEDKTRTSSSRSCSSASVVDNVLHHFEPEFPVFFHVNKKTQDFWSSYYNTNSHSARTRTSAGDDNTSKRRIGFICEDFETLDAMWKNTNRVATTTKPRKGSSSSATSSTATSSPPATLILSLDGKEATVVNAMKAIKRGASAVELFELFIQKGVAGLTDFKAELGNEISKNFNGSVSTLLGTEADEYYSTPVVSTSSSTTSSTMVLDNLHLDNLHLVEDTSSTSHSSTSAEDNIVPPPETVVEKKIKKKKRKIYRPGGPSCASGVYVDPVGG